MVFMIVPLVIAVLVIFLVRWNTRQQETTGKSTKIRWNLKQLFYWTLVLALLIPYSVALIPKPREQLLEFPIEGYNFDALLQKIDPTILQSDGSGSGQFGPDSSLWDAEYTYSMKETTLKELFTGLEDLLRQEIEIRGWKISEGKTSGNTLSFVFSQGKSRYRLYLLSVSPSEGVQSRIDPEQKAISIKFIAIGYFD